MFGLNIAFEFFFTFISSEQDKLKKGEHQPNCISEMKDFPNGLMPNIQ